MKRIFEIEFPDELGEMWMCEDNPMLCINAYCENKDGRIKATDVTSKVVYLSDDQSLPYLNRNDEHYTQRLNYAGDMFKVGWRKVELEVK